VVTEDGKPVKQAKPAKKRMAKSKLVVTQVGNTKVGSIVKASGKVSHPDGTVFFRADRNKWVAMWAGKQEAARPTAEACLAFLKKKYNHDGVVLPKE
jgi:LPS sulfotransferase NodH